MVLNSFLKDSDFAAQAEVRKAALISFFYLRTRDTRAFTVPELCEWIEGLGFARPNSSRLRANLKKSKMFLAAGAKDRFKLHPATIEALDTEFPQASATSEEVFSQGSLLLEDLLTKQRTYITSLIRQINASYENNIFDGCAVLMRRLIEVLLILVFEEKGRRADILDASGNYVMLDAIISLAGTSTDLGLSRNTKTSLDSFRKVGNFSAHKLQYNARRKTIDDISIDYRAAVEDLLYSAGLRE